MLSLQSIVLCFLCIGYHMSGEVISVLSRARAASEGQLRNCHESVQLISPSQSCDNLFITHT